MSFSLIPQYAFRDVTGISPRFLTQLSIRFLMLDLDNTIAAYNEQFPAEYIAKWACDIKGSGIELFFVSNSVRKERVDRFAEALGIGFVKGASKPSPGRLLQTIHNAGFIPDESALAGDQIFTDTLGANRAGIVSIVVRPRRLTNPLLALRYWVEAPFRAMCRNKMWNTET